MSTVTALAGHSAASTALVDDRREVTYGELLDAAGRVRGGLRALGLEAGARVGIVCTNTVESVVALVAVLGADLVAVPLDPNSPAAEQRRELDVVGASIVLTDTAPTDDLGVEVRSVSPAGTDLEPLPDGDDVTAVDAGPDDLAVMLFTSGTAGPPKAAMLTHGALEAVQLAVIGHPASDVGPATVNLAVLPLSHVYGLNISLLTTLRAGGRVVLMARFDPVGVARAAVEHRVTHFAGVPPMWQALLDAEGVAETAFAGVTRITSGAAPLPVSLFEAFRDRFGVELSEGYGLTESASGATSHLGIPVRPGSVGKALPGVEIMVVDYDDHPAPLHDSGIVKIRGANVFAGYWGDEEATKSVLDDDGWLRTGDVGVLSDDGYLWLVDRAKDLIIVSGFNVYPFEVEEVLVTHPAVDAAIVVGRDDDHRGERIVAYVTVEPGHEPPTLEDVVEHCGRELARYKLPSELRIVDQLPIAASGKHIRRELT